MNKLAEVQLLDKKSVEKMLSGGLYRDDARSVEYSYVLTPESLGSKHNHMLFIFFYKLA